MPRVITKTKNKAGKPYSCGKCSKPIKPGDKYFEWSFRYGGTHRRHTGCGYPKPSDLTQSKMSGAYVAIESAEENIQAASSKEDVEQALRDCRDECDNVKQEYEDSKSNLPEQFQENYPGQEQIDALESFVDELDSAADNLADPDFDEEPTQNEGESDEDFEKRKQAWQELFDTYLEGLRDEANQVLSNLSV